VARVRESGRRRTLTAEPRTEDLLRDLAPRVLATLARRYGDFDAAEDAAQEALIAAADRWPRTGVPEQPLAWLTRSATRRLIDAWRANRARVERERLVTAEATPATPMDHAEDDSLLLLFLCCHASLTPASAIPLTLRAVGGLTTAEIARAFLVPEATIAQRISRAKARIRASNVPFAMPHPDERAERLRSVLHVVYLVFNEGYTTSAGPSLHRVDLSDEAIRLGRMLLAAAPEEREVAGLLALMLLTDARRPARLDAQGELVPLPDQDRSLWDQGRITEGLALLARATAAGPLGEYGVQAAIAAVHDQAASADATDWPRIVDLYERLEQMTGNPVVTVNRAVAIAMVAGPAAGLALLDEVSDRLGPSHRSIAVRAHLLEMAGEIDAAVSHYRAAARRATSIPERRHLAIRAARLLQSRDAGADVETERLAPLQR
jgi:RNA polymerase sigma factor (sigma-70 family)